MTHHITTSALANRNDVGMNTAEYAVGTVAACSFGGLLYRLLSTSLGESIITGILDKVTNLLPF